MKKTLGLTGVTVNAMALIAPGAFLWMTYQLQAVSVDSSGQSTALDMWTRIVAALVVAFLTAFAFAELARRYPEAGNGANAFADPGDPHGLSVLARQFIAGQLAHARGMCAVLAPLVNSYKRLVAGYEAPVFVSWARINRSALIRVPRASVVEATRLELRCPDPSCNPYLAFVVMLAAGLDGIRRGLSIPDATEENLFLLDDRRRSKLEILPASLDEALDALQQDELVCNALGAHICDRFISAKRQEWEEYRRQVTPWELEKYLPNF